MLNRATYDATEWQLIRAEGVALALHDLALASDKVTDGSPEMSALLTLMDVLREVIQQARDCHQAEWEAAKAPQTA